MFLDMSSALPFIQAGKLRALAVATATRFDGLPAVRTVAEQGYPGFEVHGWYGLLPKAGTPAAVMQRLYAEVKRALDTKEVRDLFKAQGIAPGGMPPEEFTTSCATTWRCGSARSKSFTSRCNEKGALSMHIAIPDDYQDCVRGLDRFSKLDAHEARSFNDTVKGTDALAERFADADAIVLTRERTRIDAALLDRLPKPD